MLYCKHCVFVEDYRTPGGFLSDMKELRGVAQWMSVERSQVCQLPGFPWCEITLEIKAQQPLW